MKNQRNTNKKEISSLAITTTLVEPILLQNIVEKLADRRNSQASQTFEKVQVGWQAVRSSTIEAYVSGSVNLLDGEDKVEMPFVTCFLFTCTKIRGGKSNLVWASSLS